MKLEIKAPIMKTSLALILASTALLIVGCGGIIKGKAASEAAVTRFHQLYDEGKFDSIWKEAHPQFRSSSTKAKFDASMKENLRKLGKVKSSTTNGLQVKSVNFKTTVIMTRKTVFERGEGAETFTFEMDGGKAVLCGYKIQSTKFKETELVET